MRAMEDMWIKCCHRLRSELGEEVFSSWFGSLKLESVAAGRATFTISTRFLKSWVETHYQEKIIAALNAEHAGVVAIQIAVRANGVAVRPVANDLMAKAAAIAVSVGATETAGSYAQVAMFDATTRRPSPRVEGRGAFEQLCGSPLDRRLTFSSFLVGRGNQLAFNAAERVAHADPGGTPVFNPLYIHSTVGLGKTHMLQAIAHAAQAVGRTVMYLTAEKFMYGFVNALQTHQAIAFKDAIRAIDLLIFDDVQFLQGKVIQSEFCHTINALIDSGGQIVVAADRPPGDLESLEERVRSRLAGGLCVEIGALDEPLRLKILEARIAAAKTQNPHLEITPQVIQFVANAIASNGRDLEGAVNRLIAHSSAGGPPLTVELAELAVRDLIRAREPKRVKIEDIQKLVASHYSVTRADILSSRRTATVVKPRQVAMYLSKALTLRSLPEIGRRFGGRDHTTVLHAVRKIEGLTSSNPSMKEEIELLKRMLQD